MSDPSKHLRIRDIQNSDLRNIVLKRTLEQASQALPSMEFPNVIKKEQDKTNKTAELITRNEISQKITLDNTEKKN